MSDVAEGIVQAQGWLVKVWACSRSAVKCEETGMHLLQQPYTKPTLSCFVQMFSLVGKQEEGLGGSGVQ